MNRILFKNKAKDIIRDNFVSIIGAVIVATLLSGSLLGIAVMQEGFNITGASIQFMGINIYDLQNNEYFFYSLNIVNLVYLAFNLFIFMPIGYGVQKYFYNVSKGTGKLSDLFAAYKDGFGKIVVVGLLYGLFVLLGAVLFIIPGIIITYTYYFVNLVMIKYPELSIKEVFAKAKEISRGMKFELFILTLSFIGWYILNSLTLNILTVFVMPYTSLTFVLVFKSLVEGDTTSYE